jgi:hypothetical protein
LVVTYARGDPAALNTNINLQFNGDTAANYDGQNLQGTGAGVTAFEQFAQTSAILGIIPANTAGANLFGVAIGFIPNYAGTTNNKVCLSIASKKTGTVTNAMTNLLVGGFWRSNAAINRITLLPAPGNFVAGTRVSLYGIGA